VLGARLSLADNKGSSGHCWIRYQATTGENTAEWEALVSAVLNWSVRKLAKAL
jgi:hypothetical protein